jgi:hypothetical protein
MDPDAMFSDISANNLHLLIKDEFGEVYWPFFNYNGMGDMRSGEGYSINMDNTFQNFCYPKNRDGFKCGGTQVSTTTRIFKNYTQDIYINTDNFMIVGIPFNSWSIPPEPGDEIAALGESGQLVGKTIFKGDFAALTIYGDDVYTSNIAENLAEGESFTIEVWSANTNTSKQYNFKNWDQGDGFFSNKEISVVGVEFPVDQEDTSGLIMEVYPNPGAGNLYIELSSIKDALARVEIFDIAGRMVYFNEIQITKGKQTHCINLTSLANGSYNLVLTTGTISLQKNIIISK